MNSLKRIMAIFKKEILHVMRDRVAFSMCFLASLALTMLMGFVYEKGKVTDIPIVVYDGDKTDLSRQLLNAFNDSERLKVIKYVDSYEAVKKAIDTGKADAGIVIQQGLKKNVKSSKSQEVLVILNGNNTLVMSTVGNAALQIVQTYSAAINIKVMEGSGIAKDKAYETATALTYKSRVWHNSTGDYGAFMLLGLVGTIVQQVSFLAVALSITRDKENKIMKNLAMTKLKSYEIFTGKFLFYFLVFLANSLIVHSIAINFFEIPQRGNLFLMAFLIAIFVAAIMMIGLFISVLLKSQVQAIQLSMLLAVPSYVLSGYTWPVYSMPNFVQKISYALPLTHFLRAIKAIMYMEQGFSTIKYDLYYLVGIIVLFLPLNIFILEKNMEK